ncbi:hypothetical protein FOL47_007732 [Perkinsus chesapeaki]|uniref:Diacylglycerol kinase n=1 Tax=Perkinsus chesapeaki TaxID=330153 RepID=A0A7J6LIG2_PERCH|nr:hypothetical protein FOL47_007732 [Perkinsus chesapeaki]
MTSSLSPTIASSTSMMLNRVNIIYLFINPISGGTAASEYLTLGLQYMKFRKDKLIDDTDAIKHGINTDNIAIGVIPFGTANDFSRTLGWGSGPPRVIFGKHLYSFKNMIKEWCKAVIIPYDIWELEVKCTANGSIQQIKGSIKTPLKKDNSPEGEILRSIVKPICNYFSIGVESRVGLGFDKHRTKSKFLNKAVYVVEGTKKITFTKTPNIPSLIQCAKEADGNNDIIFTSKVNEDKAFKGKPVSIIMLNIPSIMGGCDLWSKCIIPFGTGNDFSRATGWGATAPSGFPGSRLDGLRKWLKHWLTAEVKKFDIWKIEVTLQEDGGVIYQLKDGKKVPITENDEQGNPTDRLVKCLSKPMCNYFSTGVESRLGLGFDRHRKKNPIANKLVYGVEGTKKMLFKKTPKIDDTIDRVMDISGTSTSSNEDVIFQTSSKNGDKFIEGNPVSLIAVNIPSFASGCNVWGMAKKLAIKGEDKGILQAKQDMGDGKIELVSYNSLMGMGMEQSHIVDIPSDRVYIFVNPRSGGRKAGDLLTIPNPYVYNNISVYRLNISNYNKDDKKLFKEFYKNISKTPSNMYTRILAAGGDGSVMGTVNRLREAGIDMNKITFGHIPYGTGNDFARVTGWGTTPPSLLGHDNEGINKLITKYINAKVDNFDLWKVTFTVDKKLGSFWNVVGGSDNMLAKIYYFLYKNCDVPEYNCIIIKHTTVGSGGGKWYYFIWFNNDVYVLVNGKSGGNKAAKLMDIAEEGEAYIHGYTEVYTIDIFKLNNNDTDSMAILNKLKNGIIGLDDDRCGRVIIAGGDGSVMWGVDLLMKADVDLSKIAFGVIPYGTGNDFSQSLGWGKTVKSGFPGKDNTGLNKFIEDWNTAVVKGYDLWDVNFELYEDGKFVVAGSNKEMMDDNSAVTTISKPMLNYFSLGVDAAIGKTFENMRTGSRIGNKMMYGMAGARRAIGSRIGTEQFLESVTDKDEELFHVGGSKDNKGKRKATEKMLTKNAAALICLNGLSYGGGRRIWDKSAGKKTAIVGYEDADSLMRAEQDFGDHKLELMMYPDILSLSVERQHLTYSIKPYHLSSIILNYHSSINYPQCQCINNNYKYCPARCRTMGRNTLRFFGTSFYHFGCTDVVQPLCHHQLFPLFYIAQIEEALEDGTVIVYWHNRFTTSSSCGIV